MQRGPTVEETVFEKPAKEDNGLAYLAESAKKEPDEIHKPKVAPEPDVLKDSTKGDPKKDAPAGAAAPKEADRIGYWKLYQYSSGREKC